MDESRSPTIMRLAGDKGGPLRLPLRGFGDGRVRRPPVSRPIALAAALVVIVVGSLVLAAFTHASMLLGAALFVLALAAVVFLVFSVRRRRLRESAPVPRLVIDDLGVSVVRGQGTIERLLPFRPAFGIGILASATRTTAVMALTSPGRLLCVGCQVPRDGPDRDRLMALVPLAVTIAADDLAMSTVLPDGTMLLLEGSAWLRMLDELVSVDPTALERCYLSDARGGQVVLAEEQLRTPRATFRLDQPFDWRAWVFQEVERVGSATFQATSIRQGKNEVTFVCLLGCDARGSIRDAENDRGTAADTFLLRDARLLDAPLGPPPAHDRRIAIDRLFMLPLRNTIDRAHRAHRHSVPGDASAP